jgi:hypothetical protein
MPWGVLWVARRRAKKKKEKKNRVEKPAGFRVFYAVLPMAVQAWQPAAA